MILRRLTVAVVAVFVALLVACRAQAPLQPGSNDAMDISADKMAFCIKKAATKRNWIVKEIRPGLIQARYTKGGWLAVVDIEYDTKGYKITMNNETNLKKKDNMVDNKFNQWVRNLDKDIKIELRLTELEEGK